MCYILEYVTLDWYNFLETPPTMTNMLTLRLIKGFFKYYLAFQT